MAANPTRPVGHTYAGGHAPVWPSRGAWIPVSLSARAASPALTATRPSQKVSSVRSPADPVRVRPPASGHDARGAVAGRNASPPRTCASRRPPAPAFAMGAGGRRVV